MTARVTLIAATFAAGIATAQTDELARDSQKLSAQWQCSFYAEDFEDQASKEAHFNEGLRIGRSLFQRVAESNLTDNEIKDRVGFYMSFFIASPSIDFGLGRYHNSLRREITNEVWIDIPEGDNYLERFAAQKLRARKLYHDRNCNLLK